MLRILLLFLLLTALLVYDAKTPPPKLLLSPPPNGRAIFSYKNLIGTWNASCTQFFGNYTISTNKPVVAQCIPYSSSKPLYYGYAITYKADNTTSYQTTLGSTTYKDRQGTYSTNPSSGTASVAFNTPFLTDLSLGCLSLTQGGLSRGQAVVYVDANGQYQEYGVFNYVKSGVASLSPGSCTNYLDSPGLFSRLYCGPKYFSYHCVGAKVS